jgi:hypothetical protein
MKSLIRTEWLKMRSYKAFWGIIGITALSYPGINYAFYQGYKEMTNEPTEASKLLKMAIGNPYAFPDVWHSVAFFSSFFVFFPAVVVIMFITNEYTFRTHRQNIIDGWSRNQFMTSKLLDVLMISVLVTILYVTVTLVAGFSAHTRLIRDTWGSSYFAGLFFLQTFSQLSIAFLVGFLAKRAFIALGIFLFYYLALEPLSVEILKKYGNDLGRFLPLELSDRMIPVPAFLGKLSAPEKYQLALDRMPVHTLLTVGLTLLIWLICYRLFRRQDLK